MAYQYNENTMCFFHLSKNIFLNENLDYINKYIEYIINKRNLSDIERNVIVTKYFIPDSYNYCIRFLINNIYLKILKQKKINKKGHLFVCELTNNILLFSIRENIHIYSNILTNYLNNVKIKSEILNLLKPSFREKHFIYCIQNQGISLNESLKLCYSEKEGKNIEDIVSFYRKRDTLIYKYLYFIPNPIVLTILDILG
jgi:hypothetical protein